MFFYCATHADPTEYPLYYDSFSAAASLSSLADRVLLLKKAGRLLFCLYTHVATQSPETTDLRFGE